VPFQKTYRGRCLIIARGEAVCTLAPCGWHALTIGSRNLLRGVPAADVTSDLLLVDLCRKTTEVGSAGLFANV
jgi:hypothetical protein